MAPRAPRELGDAGKKLWRELHTTFDFDDEPHKSALVKEACIVQDTLARLEAAANDAPLTTTGSMGQLVIRPEVSEARAQRALLAQLLNRIGLPDSDEEKAQKAERRSASARNAANARWNMVKSDDAS